MEQQKVHIRQALSQAQMIIIQAMNIIEGLEKIGQEQAAEIEQLKKEKPDAETK